MVYPLAALLGPPGQIVRGTHQLAVCCRRQVVYCLLRVSGVWHECAQALWRSVGKRCPTVVNEFVAVRRFEISIGQLSVAVKVDARRHSLASDWNGNWMCRAISPYRRRVPPAPPTPTTIRP